MTSIQCDRCGERAARYAVDIRDGTTIETKRLCLPCYKNAQNETIVNVSIIES